MNTTRTPTCGIPLSLTAVLFASPAVALQQHFQADLEQSVWQVQAERGQCVLTHDIPRFGQARFSQASGRPFVFTIDVPQAPLQAELAILRSVPPAWKYGFETTELGAHRLQPERKILELPAVDALRLYYELENGMFPEIGYSDWADGRDEVTVSLSAVRFRDVLPEFQTCLAGLVQLDFEIGSENQVHFATNSTGLNDAARRALNKVVQDYRSKKYGKRIVIAGHADERGAPGFNEALSKRRSQEIKAYLVRRGIPASHMEIRYYGERWPLNTASNASAWAENRRATVWLAR